MKQLLQAFAVTLLLVVGIMSLARSTHSGAWIAFTAGPAHEEDIFLMTGDGGSIRQLTPADTCATAPRWSPDGQWIAFYDPCATSLELLRIRPDGSALKRISADESQTYARWSPDAQRMVVARSGLSLHLLDIDSGDERLLAEEYTFAQVSPDGEWVYARPVQNHDSSLDRIRIDSGEVEHLLSTDIASTLSWSPDGEALVLVTANKTGNQLVRMAPDGGDRHTIPLDSAMFLFDMPAWSPDGEWVAFRGQYQGKWYLFRVRPDGRDLQRLTNLDVTIGTLEWSPDGQWIAFTSNYQGGTSIFRLRADGSAMENLRRGTSPHYAPVSGRSWHPLWLTVAALGALMLSMIGRLRR